MLTKPLQRGWESLLGLLSLLSLLWGVYLSQPARDHAGGGAVLGRAWGC